MDKKIVGDTPKLVNGSCLCGSVKYTLTGDPMTTTLCHCMSCKKATGSAFMANSYYNISQLKVEDSNGRMKLYEDRGSDSGFSIRREFCGECGSQLFARSARNESGVAVTSGTMMDGGAEWEPKMEFFCKRKAGWLGETGKGCIKMEGME